MREKARKRVSGSCLHPQFHGSRRSHRNQGRGLVPAWCVMLSDLRAAQRQHLQCWAETPDTPHFSLLRRPILELPRQWRFCPCLVPLIVNFSETPECITDLSPGLWQREASHVCARGSLLQRRGVGFPVVLSPGACLLFQSWWKMR